MTTLHLTRGLPGSGKTTKARLWVARHPEARVRVNRDDLRTMAHGGRKGTAWQEQAVTTMQASSVSGLLLDGFDVVADDTNLRPDVMAAWYALAGRVGATVEVWDLTDVPVEECVRRNEQRYGTPAYVPPEAIQGMWDSYLAPPA